MSSRFQALGLFTILLALAIALQWNYAAYAVAPGAHGDEPAHIVTGLMVRDWVAAGLPRPAMSFAENYYLHYPRVALGHWPPVFYLVQSAWTLILPPTLGWLLLMQAALAAILCLRTAQAARVYAPGWPAAASALLLLLTPPVVIYSGLIMAEILLCWLCLEAVLAFARWMEAPGWWTAAWFALWGTAACLTKVTAVWLAAMALLALLFSRRYGLFRQPSLWVAGAVVAALSIPWYLLAPGALHQASPDGVGVLNPGAPLASMMLGRRAGLAGWNLTWILLTWMGPLLGMAVWGAFRLWRDGRAMGPVVAASVAGMGLIRFAVTATAYEDRTVMPLLAPLMVCAAAAAVPLVKRWPAAVGTAVAAFSLGALSDIPAKAQLPVESAAQVCLRAEYHDATVLVGAHFLLEGALVAAVAMHDARRPGHFVLRASKLMAQSTWGGKHYQPLVHDPAEALHVLEAIPVGLLVLECDPRAWKFSHQKLLAQTVAGYPDRFRLVHSGPLRVYEVTGFRKRPRRPVSFFMYGLGRSIESGAR